MIHDLSRAPLSQSHIEKFSGMSSALPVRLQRPKTRKPCNPDRIWAADDPRFAALDLVTPQANFFIAKKFGKVEGEDRRRPSDSDEFAGRFKNDILRMRCPYYLTAQDLRIFVTVIGIAGKNPRAKVIHGDRWAETSIGISDCLRAFGKSGGEENRAHFVNAILRLSAIHTSVLRGDQTGWEPLLLVKYRPRAGRLDVTIHPLIANQILKMDKENRALAG